LESCRQGRKNEDKNKRRHTSHLASQNRKHQEFVPLRRGSTKATERREGS